MAGNVFVRGELSTATHYLPLYEAKMIWHYDHRNGTYEEVDSRSSTQLPTPDDRQHTESALCHSTLIVLDDELIQRALQVTGLKTRREVIHEALRTLIRLHEQAEIRVLRGQLSGRVERRIP